MLNKEAILAGIKEAILAEQTGMQFYENASANTADPQGKTVFQALARDEEKHREFLRRQYANIINGTPVESLAVEAAFDLSGPTPIFSPALKKRIGEAHWEMTALSVGLQLEISSVEHYRRLAGEAGPGPVHDFFETLARWEETHADALRRQSKNLLDDYWSAGRFAPF